MKKPLRAGIVTWATCCAAAVTLAQAAAVPAQPGDMDGRPNKWGYAFGRAYDAEIAAGQVHQVPFQDDHVMLMEVSNPPGYRMQMHGHPYPSIFARMTAGAAAGQGLKPSERFLEPDGKQNGQNWRNAPPPAGAMFPTCTAADPQSPHLPVNVSDVPLHFYRLEFKRIDDDEPAAVKAAYAGKPLARKLYENDVVRLLEITIAPGATDPGRANPSPAVLAFDSMAAFDALDRAEGTAAGRSPPPAGMKAPRCMTVADAVAPVVVNRTAQPLHYYRIEFKRIDGDGLRDHWQTWYPHMTEMLREQQSQQK